MCGPAGREGGLFRCASLYGNSPDMPGDVSPMAMHGQNVSSGDAVREFGKPGGAAAGAADRFRAAGLSMERVFRKKEDYL